MDDTRRESIVRTYYEHLDAGNYDAVLDAHAEGIEYSRPGHPTITGKAALSEFYHEERSVEEGTHTVASLTVDGDVVITRGTFDGVIAGEAVSVGFSEFFEVGADGAISRRWAYTDA
jgi:ketosteroid isomerase-like protein